MHSRYSINFSYFIQRLIERLRKVKAELKDTQNRLHVMTDRTKLMGYYYHYYHFYRY